MTRAPALTALDERVLAQVPAGRGVRLRDIAERVTLEPDPDEGVAATQTRIIDVEGREVDTHVIVRGILRGLEHLGYVTGAGGWWRLLERGSLFRNGASGQAAG